MVLINNYCIKASVNHEVGNEMNPSHIVGGSFS